MRMTETPAELVLRMRQIFCCKGAEFTRRELQAGWEMIQKLQTELANLREAAFEVEKYALPYWENLGDDPKAIPVSNEALRGLQAALYPEDEAKR